MHVLLSTTWLRWRDALSRGELGVWDLRPDMETVQYAPSWKRRLGFPDPEQADSTHFWRCRVHPDDLAAMQAALQAHACGDSAGYECRFRLRSNGSGYRLMHSRGRTIQRSPHGQPLRMVGTMIDLTDRAPTPQAGLPEAPWRPTPAAGTALAQPFHTLFTNASDAAVPASQERERVLRLVQDLLQATLAQWDGLRTSTPPRPPVHAASLDDGRERPAARDGGARHDGNEGPDGREGREGCDGQGPLNTRSHVQ